MADADIDVCCVQGCHNKQSDNELCFFDLPKDVGRRTAWLKLIGRNDLLDMGRTRHKICHKHFKRTVMLGYILLTLLPDAMPTKYLPSSPNPIPLTYEHDVGISDVATQTDITYGNVKDEIDVSVEVLGHTVQIKKEKGPEKEKLSAITLDKPVKREPDDDMDESGTKKRKL